MSSESFSYDGLMAEEEVFKGSLMNRSTVGIDSLGKELKKEILGQSHQGSLILQLN